MNTETSTTPTTALWLGDLHLDRASEKQRMKLLNRVYTTASDCVVVSGDISIARHLEKHLRQLASACAPRDLYFVPGNHDYHGAGMHEVEACLAELCASVDNLHYLDGKRIIPLEAVLKISSM
jgi:predicted phosphohydrolase